MVTKDLKSQITLVPIQLSVLAVQLARSYLSSGPTCMLLQLALGILYKELKFKRIIIVNIVKMVEP